MSCGESSTCGERDLVRRRVAVLIWCLPAGLVFLGAAWSAARPALWIPSFLVMGSACLLNARRCGRLHCHFTGPLFLLAALASILELAGLPIVPWQWILVAAVGGTALGYALEYLRGMYTSGN